MSGCTLPLGGVHGATIVEITVLALQNRAYRLIFKNRESDGFATAVQNKLLTIHRYCSYTFKFNDDKTCITCSTILHQSSHFQLSDKRCSCFISQSVRPLVCPHQSVRRCVFGFPSMSKHTSDNNNRNRCTDRTLLRISTTKRSALGRKSQGRTQCFLPLTRSLDILLWRQHS